jgi:methylglutaconyl-CoA hydratase
MTTLQIQNQNAVATVTLNRPDVHNAFNEDLMKDLHEAFGALATDNAVRAVVLTGAGKSFCAGGDLNYMKSAATKNRAQNVSEALFMAEMFKRLRDCPKPTIALVNGAAFGGGVGLAAACDIVLAHQSAVFSLSEVKLGLAPSVISPFVLTRMASPQAQRYFLSGERFDAVEAARIGLVTAVYDDASRETILSGLLKNLLANGPQAMAAIKNLLRANRTLPEAALTQFTAEQIADLRASTEAQEGMTAFFEKRPAAYVIKA